MDYSAELPPGYVYATDKSDSEDTTCLRSNITSSAEWSAWLTKFEEMSSQKFIVNRTYNEPVRCVNRNVMGNGCGYSMIHDPLAWYSTRRSTDYCARQDDTM